MTPELHAQQKAWIVASLLLADSRSERHGVYSKRAPKVSVKVAHAFALPVVVETTRERRPL